MAVESNRRYQDLHAAAGNAVRVLLSHAPVGTTLVERLRTMPPWVMEVAMYCIRLGAALAMTVVHLWLSEDLTMVELGFPRDELSVA